MSYQVLARKWRPRDFTTLVGQEHVVKALTHALEQQRLHHAYLFTGTRGVGKTTLSRILAKSLNCIGPDGTGTVTAQPCGVCRVCTEIDSGRFVDYIEMDAASNRGVDEMAQLLDKAIYAPSSARFKIYMIDEVHMLTNHAFNAMLKTLEEPPEHVKFILATTDPQKIPVTVLSRCLQFNLKQMPPAQIVGHLDKILHDEQIGFEANALRLLAQAAHGSMRDALSLTDQAIAYSAGVVSEVAVRGMLGAIDQSYLVRLLDALVVQDGPTMIAVADDMADRSLSFGGALQDLASLLHKIALVQSVPEAMQDEWPEAGDIARFAEAFDAQEVQLFYQIANLGRNELALAPDEYAGFTMTLLRMLAFRPAQLDEAGGSRPESAPSRSAALVSRRPASTAMAPRQPVAEPAVADRPAAFEPAVRKNAPSVEPAAVVASIAPVAPVTASVSVPAAVTPAAPVAAPTAAPAAASVPPAATRPLSPAMAALAAARQLKGAGAAARNSRLSETQPAAPVAPPPAAPVPRAAPAPVAVKQSAAEPAPWDDMPPAPPDDMPLLGPYETDSAFALEPAVAEAPVGRRVEQTMEDAVTEAIAPPRERMSQAPSEGQGEFANTSRATPSAEALPIISSADAAALPGGNWIAFAAQLPVKGLAQQLAHQSELIAIDGVTFHLRVPLNHLAEGMAAERLQVVLAEQLNQPIRLAFEIAPVTQTVAIADEKARVEEQQGAEDSIQSDPFVQSLLRDFDGQIVPGSIQPRAS